MTQTKVETIHRLQIPDADKNLPFALRVATPFAQGRVIGSVYYAHATGSCRADITQLDSGETVATYTGADGRRHLIEHRHPDVPIAHAVRALQTGRRIGLGKIAGKQIWIDPNHPYLSR